MSEKIKADMALAFCSLIWGVTFVVVKNALDHASVFVFLAVRFTLAAGLMAMFRPKVLARLDGQEIFAGLRLAFFMFAGYAFQTSGLQFTTASHSGFVTGSSVVLVPVLLGIFWGRRLTKWMYAGSLAALAGLYFLTVPAEGMRYLNPGDVLTFVAAGLYAVHIILVGEFTKQHSVSALSLIQVAGCAGMAWVADGSRRGNSLAGGAVCVAVGLAAGDWDLRGVCHGGGVHSAIVGAAVYVAGACGDLVCAGAGVCGDYVVPRAAGKVERAGLVGSGNGGGGDCDRGIAGAGGSAGIAGAGV